MSALVGGPLVGIEEFESRGSTVHTHYDGREIQRTFHLVPAFMAPAVVGAMQGSVAVTEEGVAHRIFPARDPDYPECYCNEVKVTDVDPRAIASSDTLQLNAPALVGNTEAEQEVREAGRHTTFMTNLNRIPDEPAGGCFLTASYRPLITGWHPEYGFGDILTSSIDQRFDWINPHFTPSVRTVPWPDGLQIATKDNDVSVWTPTVPDEVAQPVNVPVKEFTVKRLFVDRPRWELLDGLLNAVNAGAWPQPWPITADGRAHYEGIPQFPAGTLRFDSYELIEHHSPFPASAVWYELVYHFSWISLKDYPVFNERAELAGAQGYADVTWNHVLMRPSVPLTGGIVKQDLGWYFVMRIRYPDWYIAEGVGAVGPVYSLRNFDSLFMLNPPALP